MKGFQNICILIWHPRKGKICLCMFFFTVYGEGVLVGEGFYRGDAELCLISRDV